MVERVWIVVHDGGYEGHSEPAAAFADKALAEIFISGTAAAYGNWKICELPLQSLAALALPIPGGENTEGEKP